MHRAILHPGPVEFSIFKPLGHQAHAAAVPEDQFDSVRAFGPEHIDRARERVGTHLRLHQRCQSFRALAEVDRLGGDHDFYRAGRADHD